jgi:hypothetical protein
MVEKSSKGGNKTKDIQIGTNGTTLEEFSGKTILMSRGDFQIYVEAIHDMQGESSTKAVEAMKTIAILEHKYKAKLIPEGIRRDWRRILEWIAVGTLALAVIKVLGGI